MEVLQELDATVSRQFHLEKAPEVCTGDAWEIRSIDTTTGAVPGSKWIDINELPELGETEKAEEPWLRGLLGLPYGEYVSRTKRYL
jgi:hypothetical protein